MEKSRINVTKSSMPTFEEYCEEIKPLWESRWLSNRGVESIKFEEELKKYLNVEEVYCFANGHVALEVAINGLKLEGEVITTAYTHISTTHSIVRNGLTPVFVDIKEDNYTIDPDLVEKAITDKTVAIVATHVYGFICDVEKIEKIAKKHNLYVIYDAAHAFGVTYKGIGVGNFGDISMFSTHATKVFHTIEGGIVSYKTKDNEKFLPMREIVNFGFRGHEEVCHIGTNARMNEFEAAMGVCNLRHIDEEIAKRKVVAEHYYKRLDGVDGIKIPKPDKDTKWNYSYFPVIFDGYKLNRNEVQEKLGNSNIYARKYFFPITNKVECYKEKYGLVDLPISNRISDTVLTLPLYADMTIDDVDRVCDEILND